MNQIGSIKGLIYPLFPHPGPSAVAQATAYPTAATTSDRVELSELGSLLSDLTDRTIPRLSRIVEIRSAIEHGEYETDDKLDHVVDRVHEALFRS